LLPTSYTPKIRHPGWFCSYTRKSA
jgi:hypothetical protein